VEATAVLPQGWRERLVRFESAATSGVVAWCLEPHDLWISKAAAGRPKDFEFCRALLRSGLVDRGVLGERLHQVESLKESVRSSIRGWIDRPA
jgi:hypothetical protein